jgi:hypothetical protein
MTPERQRVVIADLCGLRPFLACGHPTYCDPKNHYNLTEVPDYLNDLNAMHEAMKSIPKESRHEFHRQLYILTKPVPFDMWEHNWAFIMAGPEIVAKAFIRTFDKWEEST